MTDEPIEIVRGSGNVFADFGHPNASAEQLKAISVNKDTAWLVFSPAFFVAAART